MIPTTRIVSADPRGFSGFSLKVATGSIPMSLSELDSAELAELRMNKLGFVFQAYNLIPVFTARENVEFVM